MQRGLALFKLGRTEEARACAHDAMHSGVRLASELEELLRNESDSDADDEVAPAQTSPSASSSAGQGRWTCHRCEEPNKAERTHCNNCGLPRAVLVLPKIDPSSQRPEAPEQLEQQHSAERSAEAAEQEQEAPVAPWQKSKASKAAKAKATPAAVGPRCKKCGEALGGLTMKKHKKVCTHRDWTCPDCGARMPFHLSERHPDSCGSSLVVCEACNMEVPISLASTCMSVRSAISNS